MKRIDQLFGIVVATAALMLLAAAPAQAKKVDKNKQRAEATQSSSADSKCWPEVDATFDENTYSVLTESTKDLSNVVLLFADGSMERVEDLSDKEGVFAGTGENTGKVLTGVWIKSGCNHSGDGPGYGEFVENPGTVTNLPVISIGDAPGVIEPGLIMEVVEVLFEVSLSEMVPLDGEPVVVSYATRDGTATAEFDYFPEAGVLIFLPGEITKTISVFVNDDRDVELEETFFVDLSNPENALLGNATGTGTIIDDEEEG